MANTTPIFDPHGYVRDNAGRFMAHARHLGNLSELCGDPRVESHVVSVAEETDAHLGNPFMMCVATDDGEPVSIETGYELLI